MRKLQLPEELPVGQDVILMRQEDYFLPLAALAKVSGLSVKKLRSLLADPTAPMPHFRAGGKILVRWSEFMSYMEHFRARPPIDVARIVQEIFIDLQKGRRPGRAR